MIQTNTAIVSARIFLHGAEIRRTGKLSLPSGKETLCISGLTQRTDTSTVRLYFPEGISCSNIRFSGLSDDDEKESDEIKKEIDQCTHDIESKQLQISLWQTNGDFTNRTSASAEEVEKYISLLGERLSSLYEDISVLEKKKNDLERKLSETEEKETRPLILVDLENSEEREVPFEVVYHENSPDWNPVYEIHSDGQGPLEIRMRANIHQYTNEDWHNVKITLYSGNPSGRNILPEIHPVGLKIAEPVVRMNKFAMSGMMMGAAARGAVQEDTMMMEDMELAETPEASVTSEDTMTEYELPLPLDIASHRDGIMADLQKTTINAEYRIIAIPKKDPHAYLTARISPADLPLLLNGNIAVYLKGIYTGTTLISPDQEEEKIDISLGKEECIQLHRRQKKGKTSAALLKNQRTTEYAYETLITSTSSQPSEIVVYDQIPVSQDKLITVEKGNLDGCSEDAETGILTKTVTVSSDASVTLHLEYKVLYPKDKQTEETTLAGSGMKRCSQCGALASGKFCPECGAVIS